MAISAQVNITDLATPAITALEGAMEPKQIAAAIGEAEVTLFQKHFVNAGPNKQGWPSTDFWSRAAKATNAQASPNAVIISVAQVGVRQRLQGGDIFPTGDHQYLAIPARAEAYGRAPEEFDNLKVGYSRRGAFALVENDATRINGGRQNKAGQRDFSTEVVGGGVFFWLVKSVHQEPDPTVIPDDRDIMQVASETLNAIIERVSGGAS